jgi:hypothetical protein
LGSLTLFNLNILLGAAAGGFMLIASCTVPLNQLRSYPREHVIDGFGRHTEVIGIGISADLD